MGLWGHRVRGVIFKFFDSFLPQKPALDAPRKPPARSIIAIQKKLSRRICAFFTAKADSAALSSPYSVLDVCVFPPARRATVAHRPDGVGFLPTYWSRGARFKIKLRKFSRTSDLGEAEVGGRQLGGGWGRKRGYIGRAVRRTTIQKINNPIDVGRNYI